MVQVIGMGPGDIKQLTLEAYEKIKNSEAVVAFGRISKTAELIKKPVYKISRVSELMDFVQRYEKVTVLASGDPCFYGIIQYIKDNGIEIEGITPGISSFQYMMAKLQKSWQGACFISLHGREEELGKVRASKTSIILTDSNNTPDSISRKLADMGVKGSIYVGFNLSYEDERIITVNIGDEIEIKSNLSVMVIENEMD